MKKVHLITCLTLWSLWVTGIIFFLIEVWIYVVTGDNSTYFFAVISSYCMLLFLLSFVFVPVEVIMFIITAIIETLNWTKKSLLTVVLPFGITVVLWLVYFFVMGIMYISV